MNDPTFKDPYKDPNVAYTDDESAFAIGWYDEWYGDDVKGHHSDQSDQGDGDLPF